MRKISLSIGFLICINLVLVQSQTATLRLPDIPAPNAGEEVLIPIMVDDISSDLICCFQISIKTDDMYLSWNGTNLNPEPGMVYKHPNLTMSWPDWILINDSINELTIRWTAPCCCHFSALVNPGDVLFVLSYTFNGGLPPGGSTPIYFGENKDMKFETQLYDIIFNLFDLTLINGSLNMTTSISNAEIENIIIFSKGNNIYVMSPESSGNIIVYNLLGQLLIDKKIKKGTTEIPLESNNSYLFINVFINDFKLSRKLFIK